jgi:hypothetical protein
MGTMPDAKVELFRTSRAEFADDDDDDVTEL